MPAPELRIDPLTGLRTVLAPARADRPFSFESSEAHDAAREACPLCEGHESWTPPETFALRPGGGPPDSPGWLVRAVPNKYPLLEPAAGDATGEPPDSTRGDPDLLVSLARDGPSRGDRPLPRARRVHERPRARSSFATRSRAGESGPPRTPTPPTCT